MRLVRRLVAFGGWVDDSIMEVRAFDHAGQYAVGVLALVFASLALATLACAYLTVDALATRWTETTIAQVVTGAESGQHVVVTGKLAGMVTISCDSRGGCDYLSAVADDVANVVFVIGTRPRPNPDGTVTVKGSVGSNLPDDPDVMHAAAALEALSAQTSSVVIDGRRLNDNPIAMLVFTVLVGGFAVLLAVAYRSGIVPFVESRDPRIASAVAVESHLTDVPCGLTGTLLVSVGRGSFRDRPTLITVGGTWMALWMTKWWPRHIRNPRTYVRGAHASIGSPNLVAEPVRGKAYLVLSTKPAIKLVTDTGPLILTFKEEATRDTVFARICSWPSDIIQSESAAITDADSTAVPTA